MSGHTELYEEVMRHGVQPWSHNCLCGHRFFDRPSPPDLAEHLARALDARFDVTPKPTIT